MISITCKGDFGKTESFLEKIITGDPIGRLLDECGRKGVAALKDATPRDSGKTASSWYYDVSRDKDGVTITWSNSNINDGVPIAIILQYGHGTGTGGYVRGIDYINPAIKPVFDEISQAVWKGVVNSG